ncbi:MULTISPECIES: hypothetical protein [Pseudomonas]|uniref:hypothetical protein n=1 Tax=Pseudomonas TaxID=286 RepID=UPI001EF13808|nr:MULTISPECIES: hypothetical protein [Pseudomonas]MCF5692456.1 hypothetical protein [Pseudomonas sp. PA-1-8C]MCF5787619.1 hypothetical protein [Pseudomonas sp. PA-1-6G]MCF5795339.1 hypothetical protein [Pseudomonas sp. PA-1-6B]MCF5800567.1 hypothetical protein [Pseudomonas sp. PA-1-5A]MCF5837074.1 hypothetical protein [Pseudomonas sp. PA-1-6A]
MPNKTMTIETFMTENDEYNFSILLRSEIPRITFIDDFVWSTPNPPFHETLAQCKGWAGSNAAILDEMILSSSDYKKTMVTPHQSGSGFIGGTIGKGLIQFHRSYEADYAKTCLRNGRIAASYDPENDPETDIFVKTVWRLFKKHALKVHLVNMDSGEIHEKPEKRFFSWPDAAEKYDGKNGNYLTNTAMAYFRKQGS